MKKPSKKTLIGAMWALSFVALALLFVVPRWWPLLIGIHLLGQSLVIYPTLRPNCGWFGPVVRSFQTDAREVWLTIDDGPHPDNTPRILELLKRFDARATFFIVGERVRAHPQLARAIIEQGHTLGNHSATHPTAFFWGLGRSAVAREVEEGSAAIQGATGIAPAWFRAPVGMANLFVHEIIHERRMRLIGWSARGFDAVERDVTTVVENVLRDIRPGAIVLLHEGGSSQKGEPVNVLAIETILERLRAEGYKCVVPDDHRLRICA
ncbi:MAG: polysaccharide deacetylase family protein [Limisphaerales bacterium]